MNHAAVGANNAGLVRHSGRCGSAAATSASAKTVLLVCSGGGHLKQLHLLAPRLRIDAGKVVWATFDTALSRSLLADQDVFYIPYSAPRDVAGTVRNSRLALHLMRTRHFDAVVSTGANPALSFVLPARLLGKPCHFIESATRSRGPSMTGRILGPLPGVHAYTQSTTWASDRWRYIGSIFDSFASVPSAEPVSSIRRVVVTVGTTESYGFRSLFERLVQVLPRGVETLWQTGATDVSELPIEARPKLPASVLSTALRDADVVVAHAGTGSALAALEAGKYPVLVPRRGHRREHIDDHQLDTAADLERRGLALHREVDGLQFDDLYAAAQRRVHVTAEPSPVQLVGWS